MTPELWTLLAQLIIKIGVPAAEELVNNIVNKVEYTPEKVAALRTKIATPYDQIGGRA